MSTIISGGQFKGLTLETPEGSETRPTSNKIRQALFNIIGQNLSGLHFYDIYAGSGSVGFEAISRGASKVTFIEKSKSTCELIRSNARKLKVLEQVEVLNADAIEYIKILSQSETKESAVVFVDPPFDQEFPSIDILANNYKNFECLVVQYPTAMKSGLWFQAKKIKKYGVSSLAIFED